MIPCTWGSRISPEFFLLYQPVTHWLQQPPTLHVVTTLPIFRQLYQIFTLMTNAPGGFTDETGNSVYQSSAPVPASPFTVTQHIHQSSDFSGFQLISCRLCNKTGQYATGQNRTALHLLSTATSLRCNSGNRLRRDLSTNKQAVIVLHHGASKITPFLC